MAVHDLMLIKLLGFSEGFDLRLADLYGVNIRDRDHLPGGSI
jgi:hypothetical protein